jgi:NADH dehydrogenase
MATIGTHRAVADIKGWRFGGVLAWLAWSVIHLMFLIGFRTKLFVMAGWIFDYLAHGREARLITGTFKLKVRDPRRGERVPISSAPPPESVQKGSTVTTGSTAAEVAGR